MSTMEATSTPMPGVSNYQIILRLLKFMKPLNWYMFLSLSARVIKLVGQAAVLVELARREGDEDLRLVERAHVEEHADLSQVILDPSRADRPARRWRRYPRCAGRSREGGHRRAP